MRGDRAAPTLSRETLLKLMAEHKTQHRVAAAAGVSRSTISRLARRYDIVWPNNYVNSFGNDDWRQLAEDDYVYK